MGSVGQAIAHTLSGAGYLVYLTYRSASPEDTMLFMQSLGGNQHTAVQCDISKFEDVSKLIDQIKTKHERFDVCVHTASDTIVRQKIEDMTPSQFRSQFEASVFGAFNFFSQIVPILKSQQSGLIIAITTSAIDNPEGSGKMSGYIAAKYALEGLLRETARECKTSGVRVNAIAPDLMHTKLTADLPTRLFEFLAEKDPRGRITTPEDVAGKVLYLVNEGNTVSGMSLDVATDAIRPL